MSFDARAFRNALGCFPTGIVVVTAGTSGNWRGITVNSFASLSLDPPLILWCIAKTSRRYLTFTNATEFTVSILGEADRAAAEAIATAGEGELTAIELEECEPPAIKGAIAVFECARETLHDGGDHVIVVGRVHAFRHRNGAPLTFFRGRYGKIVE
ncbi:flavin reductase family protein [Rhizomicrobium electricum]|uniref:Flavin reductase family protein n=1 Tax=Rhizomicrobium electricum TaxID=480070 RepID=A0ABN1EPC4_9PROT|nr:flavin reductase family protein [Rhizomicrobium electricum]NIJ48812.1 flavin reductase (DIM6/NTAB) family NADH-FMN oxidoreductase RutF [Rhizomicrobium electricum]